MKMKDSFTRVLPSYNHEASSCYRPSASHVLHPIFETDTEGKPAAHISRRWTHKMDEVKDYSESMYRLGIFAPPPRKAAS